MDNDELRASYDAMMEHYNDIKAELRRRGGFEYDRWKAAGCAVDDDFISMYPTLGELIERLEDDSDSDMVNYCGQCGGELSLGYCVNCQK